MEKILVSDVHEVTRALENDGYKLTFNQKGRLVFNRGQEKIEIALIDYIDEEIKTVKPNYDNCSINVIASIRKHFNAKINYKTNPIIDELLETNKYKHIAILLLDGMGSYIIRKNLAEDSFIANNKVSDMYAVFPSTTACAVPALQSGLAPIETGWLGWENYFKEIDRHVVMFRNQDFYTGEDLDFNVKEKLSYNNFYDDLDVFSFELGPSFYPDGCETFSELCDRYLSEIKKHGSTVSYLYWSQPDTIMHESGAYSLESKKSLNEINDILAQFSEKLPEDTLVIVTADHGHINVKPIYFTNYTDLTNCLSGLPSNEGRATFFKVKLFHRIRFEKAFKKYFAGYFKLYKRDEFIKAGFLGPNLHKASPYIKDFIGDYVAIATHHYYFNYNPNMYSKEDDDMVFKSHHAGMTANEMMVPLIIIKK